SAHNDQKHGFFAVNMAGTGTGKTFANAKIMLALSENQSSLRYILALGLRTLTLQTGNDYRKRIFQNADSSDLAVLIGSKAIASLHNDTSSNERANEPSSAKGSESAEPLLETSSQLDYDEELPDVGLNTILPTAKSRQLLYAPILACTID